MSEAKRISLRLSVDQYDKLQHFAKKSDMSLNEFILQAITQRINWMVNDYDVPQATVQRIDMLVNQLNHLTEADEELSRNVMKFINMFFDITNANQSLGDDS